MRIEIMTRRGDEAVAEWTLDTDPDELGSIARRFDELVHKGYSAFGVTSGEHLRHFDAVREEDVVFIAPFTGG
jgi:hypothetical protein